MSDRLKATIGMLAYFTFMATGLSALMLGNLLNGAIAVLCGQVFAIYLIILTVRTEPK